MINLNFASRFKLHQKTGEQHPCSQSSVRNSPEDDINEDPLCVAVPQLGLGMRLLI